MQLQGVVCWVQLNSNETMKQDKWEAQFSQDNKDQDQEFMTAFYSTCPEKENERLIYK